MKVVHIDDKPTKYVIKFLVIIFPMLIVPIVSYDFLTIYFKHFTAIYSGMVAGFMLGLILLLLSEKIPKLIKQNISK